MTQKTRTILIPHDGSALSSRSAEILAPLLPAGTQVTLLHVDDGQPVDERAMTAAEKTLCSNGATVTRRTIASKDPAGVILDVAAELRPSLVAMSTHGRGGIERITRGSVAERVLRGCPVSVLMTNPFTGDGSSTIESVLVPLDGSHNSTEVLDSVIPFAKAFSARVVLLYVDWIDPTDTPTGAAKRRAMRQADIEGWLAEPRERVAAADIEVSIEIAHGNVADELIRLAQPEAYGLLAMTTHGRTGPGRWLLGSTAEAVLRHCRLPLLLHRIGSAAFE
ncbi:MAG: universal stress protein [Deltaproteobacteria bacterium]|nr:universal stress protein [Deltaproteobacteria bacterium]